MVTLRTLVDERLLSPARTELVTSPPRIATANPRTRAVLGYLSTNCGSCHDGEGEIAALGPVLKIRDLLQDGDAVARNFIDHRTRWAVPGVAENASVLTNPHAVDESAMLVRMRSRRPSSQMPPLGTAVRDQAAVDAIARWIAVDLAVMR
jgi:mono/diheme cytochrome c family protein